MSLRGVSQHDRNVERKRNSRKRREKLRGPVRSAVGFVGLARGVEEKLCQAWIPCCRPQTTRWKHAHAHPQEKKQRRHDENQSETEARHKKSVVPILVPSFPRRADKQHDLAKSGASQHRSTDKACSARCDAKIRWLGRDKVSEGTRLRQGRTHQAFVDVKVCGVAQSGENGQHGTKEEACPEQCLAVHHFRGKGRRGRRCERLEGGGGVPVKTATNTGRPRTLK